MDINTVLKKNRTYFDINKELKAIPQEVHDFVNMEPKQEFVDSYKNYQKQLKNNYNLKKLRTGKLGYDKKNVKKWKRQRIKRGYCGYDLFGLDNYLIRIIPNAIDDLANTMHTWSDMTFESPEKNTAYLHELATKFRYADYLIYETMVDRVATQLGRELLAEAFQELSIIFCSLWD